MSESQTASEVSEETTEYEITHKSHNNESMIDSPSVTGEALQQLANNQCEFLQRQKGVEELLGRFLERQQGVEDLLGQLLRQQSQESHNKINIAEMPGQIIKNQTVGGDENPASEFTTASDREARDIFAAHSLLSLRDPGELTVDKSAADSNPRLYYGTLTDESSRQCARSVEGATHASVDSSMCDVVLGNVPGVIPCVENLLKVDTY